MSKTLIIAEKPKQMIEYAKVLGFHKNGEFYEKDNFIMYCALGHLLELAEDTKYRPEGNWNASYLPILPQINQYVFEPKRNDAGRKKQLDTFGKLFKNPDISMIFVATDPDREGELIFRYIYNYFKCKIPYKRIWIKSLVNQKIKEAFAQPEYKQGDTFLENLSKSAYVRVITDWLIGVNATQSATLHLGNGNLLSIGRVQTTILKIICERYLKNKNHQKTYTYKIITEHTYNGIKYIAESPIYENKEQTISFLQNLLPSHTFVSYEKKIKKENPPLLHTLDSLTIVANKLFKLTASQVLASAQRLYEVKLISYPRTEDPYITEEGYNEIKKFLINLVEQQIGVKDFTFPKQTPNSVNDSKIKGSHDALVPTGETNGIENLSAGDKLIYQLILLRCLESFSDIAIYEKGVYLFDNQKIPFKTYTNKLLELGWKKYSPKNKEVTQEQNEIEKEEIFILKLPYKQGDKISIENKNLKEIESKPPAIYTPATLIDNLSNLAKFLQEENPKLYNQLQNQIDFKELEIGTKGTRPNIIEHLVKTRKYIAYEKNKYIPTDLGMQFYQAIKNLDVVSVTQTAKLEYQLKQVKEGILQPENFYQELTIYIKNMVQNIFSIEIKIQKQEKEKLGICPQCKKGNIIEGQKSFGCSQWKEGCKFTIWKEIAGKKLTTKNIKDLLSKGKTGLIKGFKSKSGNNFEAYLILDSELKIKFEFAPQNNTKTKK